MSVHGDEPLILRSAHKHGVADEDMLHALRNAIHTEEYDDGFVMTVGGSSSGHLIEVGWIIRSNGWVMIVHAMPARTKFLPFRRGDQHA